MWKPYSFVCNIMTEFSLACHVQVHRDSEHQRICLSDDFDSELVTGPTVPAIYKPDWDLLNINL